MSVLGSIVTTVLGMAGLGQYAAAADQAIGALPALEAAAATPEVKAALTALEGIFAKLGTAIESQVAVTESRIGAIKSIDDFLKVQTTWTPAETQAWEDKQSGGNN